MTRTARSRCIDAALVVAFLALLLGWSCAADAQELGHHLYGLGYRIAVWKDYNDINRTRYGAFSPSSTWAGAPACAGNVLPCPGWTARYGAGSWPNKGTLSGERASPDAVAWYMTSRGLGRMTPLDLSDARMVNLAWDQEILPAYVLGDGGGEPATCPPCAACPSCPACPACPPGVSASGLAAAIAKLEQALAGLKALLPPSSPSTGSVKLRVVP